MPGGGNLPQQWWRRCSWGGAPGDHSVSGTLKYSTCHPFARPRLGHMIDNVKSLVASGYDTIAEGYLERYASSAVRDHWLGELVALLPNDSRVLDLGCGAGIPVARELSV